MPSRNPSRLCRVHSSVINHPCRRFFGASGLPSRSAYPLPYLSFLFVVVCLLAPSYTQPIDCANRDSETLLKPLQTLAFIGVSQPHDGDTKKRRGHHSQGDGLEPRPQQPRHGTTERRPRHGLADTRPRTRSPRPRRPRSCTATSHMQLRKQRNAPARYHTTRNTSTEQTFERTDVR